MRDESFLVKASAEFHHRDVRQVSAWFIFTLMLFLLLEKYRFISGSNLFTKFYNNCFSFGLKFSKLVHLVSVFVLCFYRSPVYYWVMAMAVMLIIPCVHTPVFLTIVI